MNTWKDINPGDLPVGTRALADKIAALSLRCDRLAVVGNGADEMSWEATGYSAGRRTFYGWGSSVNEAVNAAIEYVAGLGASR